MHLEEKIINGLADEYARNGNCKSDNHCELCTLQKQLVEMERVRMFVTKCLMSSFETNTASEMMAAFTMGFKMGLDYKETLLLKEILDG